MFHFGHEMMNRPRTSKRNLLETMTFLWSLFEIQENPQNADTFYEKPSAGLRKDPNQTFP